MESNTPIPYQRNRRAGRITPLPQDEGTAASPAPSSPQPAVAPQQQAYSPTLTPVHGRMAAQPRAAQPESAATPYMRPQAAAPRPRVASPERRTVPASERPQAAGDRRAARQEAGASYRSAPKTRPAHAPAQKMAPAKTPSWLMTALCVLLVAVMALVAATALMQAYLKTAADKREAAYEAILYNYHVTGQEDGTLRVTWQDMIERYAAEYNLQPAFVTAIIRNESSFRTDAVSSAGARGLMQMMPATAEWVAGKLDEPYDFDRLFDAETSIRYGCWYLNYLSNRFGGDPVLVCAAYHAGQGEVWGWLGDPDISPDGVTVAIDDIPISNTKTYAGRVTQAYGIYESLLYPQPQTDQPGDGAADALPSAGR